MRSFQDCLSKSWSDAARQAALQTREGHSGGGTDHAVGHEATAGFHQGEVKRLGAKGQGSPDVVAHRNAAQAHTTAGKSWREYQANSTPDRLRIAQGKTSAAVAATKAARLFKALSFAEIIKDADVADVHATTALGNETAERRRKKPKGGFNETGDPPLAVMKGGFRLNVPIIKRNDELQMIYGWASVTHDGGQIVTDHQGDQIPEAEIVKAAHEFMAASRTGGVLHADNDDGSAYRGGQVVESLVLTPDVQKALGVDLGKAGWFIGYHVEDPDVWKLVKSGVLKSFSIGGRAQRVPNGG